MTGSGWKGDVQIDASGSFPTLQLTNNDDAGTSADFIISSPLQITDHNHGTEQSFTWFSGATQATVNIAQPTTGSFNGKNPYELAAEIQTQMRLTDPNMEVAYYPRPTPKFWFVSTTTFSFNWTLFPSDFVPFIGFNNGDIISATVLGSYFFTSSLVPITFNTKNPEATLITKSYYDQAAPYFRFRGYHDALTTTPRFENEFNSWTNLRDNSFDVDRRIGDTSTEAYLFKPGEIWEARFSGFFRVDAPNGFRVNLPNFTNIPNLNCPVGITAASDTFTFVHRIQVCAVSVTATLGLTVDFISQIYFDHMENGTFVSCRPSYATQESASNSTLWRYGISWTTGLTGDEFCYITNYSIQKIADTDA